jgi:PIN domain nuclease of toxin-antitoxin system
VTGLVFDTSAVLAVLFGEAGGDAARAALAEGGQPLVSAVNAAEAVGQVLRRQGGEAAAVLDSLRAIGLEITAFGAAEAAEAGRLEPLFLRRGISLGDRACLALAGLRGLPVLTADRAWATLGLDLDIRLIR